MFLKSKFCKKSADDIKKHEKLPKMQRIYGPFIRINMEIKNRWEIDFRVKIWFPYHLTNNDKNNVIRKLGGLSLGDRRKTFCSQSR